MCKMKQCDENQYSKEKDQNTVLLKEKSLTTGWIINIKTLRKELEVEESPQKTKWEKI